MKFEVYKVANVVSVTLSGLCVCVCSY